jgi:hypothetical protein
MSSCRSSVSVTLGVEEFENRLCLSGGPHADDSLFTVVQNAQGANALTGLITQYQQGMDLAKNLIQSLAGKDNFMHVAIDDQIVRTLTQNGAVRNAELELSSAAGDYSRGNTGRAGDVANAVGHNALVAGFLAGLADDYTRSAIADISHLTSLGSTVVSGIAASIQSITKTSDDIVGGLHTSAGFATDDFGRLGEGNELESENESETETESNDTSHGGGHS